MGPAGMAELDQAPSDTPESTLLLCGPQLARSGAFRVKRSPPRLARPSERLPPATGSAWQAGNGGAESPHRHSPGLLAGRRRVRGRMAPASGRQVDGSVDDLARAGLRALQPWEGLERKPRRMAAFYGALAGESR